MELAALRGCGPARGDLGDDGAAFGPRGEDGRGEAGGRVPRGEDGGEDMRHGFSRLVNRANLGGEAGEEAPEASRPRVGSYILLEGAHGSTHLAVARAEINQ